MLDFGDSYTEQPDPTISFCFFREMDSWMLCLPSHGKSLIFTSLSQYGDVSFRPNCRIHRTPRFGEIGEFSLKMILEFGRR